MVKMKIRKNCKYAVACVSSMGLRITPENRMAVHNTARAGFFSSDRTIEEYNRLIWHLQPLKDHGNS